MASLSPLPRPACLPSHAEDPLARRSPAEHERGTVAAERTGRVATSRPPRTIAAVSAASLYKRVWGGQVLQIFLQRRLSAPNPAVRRRSAAPGGRCVLGGRPLTSGRDVRRAGVLAGGAVLCSRTRSRNRWTATRRSRVGGNSSIPVGAGSITRTDFVTGRRGVSFVDPMPAAPLQSVEPESAAGRSPALTGAVTPTMPPDDGFFHRLLHRPVGPAGGGQDTWRQGWTDLATN